MPDYEAHIKRSESSRKRLLNLVDQVTEALKNEAEDGDEEVESLCAGIDAIAAGFVYIGDSIRQAAAASLEAREG